ncbi:MAG TPA: rod shape-determining protein RodA [Chloroflexia bacterium]|nr:rod shape-determining protein RodA [Chloroflexia bacterium]
MRAAKLHTIDLPLLLCTMAAFALGVVMIYSATKASHVGGISLGDPPVRQAIYGIAGLLLMFIISRMDYRFMESFTVIFYVLSVGLLGLVLVLGVITYGSQRWIDFGIFPVQPSELVKLSVVVLLAKLYADHQRELDRPKWFMLAALLAIGPAAMVFLQPDLGTAIMVVAVFVGMTLGAGVRARILVTTGVLSIPIAFVFWNWVMHPYQRDRLLIFLDPQKDMLGQGYNILQARTAIGGGGWLGQGYLSGTQTQLEFTKVQYSDFIFSVVAEEFGFIGAVALIALLFLLVWRCLVVASRAQDAFGSLIAVGVATWIGVQIFINVGMNIGLMPVTGIPLPFISYGGSSLISMLLGLGLVQSVALRSSPVIFGGNQWRPGWGRAGRTTLRPR